MSSGLSGRAMRALALLFGCLLMCTFAVAQSTTDGAIGGTVFDKAGAVVGGAKIVVHNNGTNAEQTVNADSSGNYRVPGLQPGSYTVSITAGQLAPYKAERVIVEVGSITDVSPHLGVQGTSEVVDVSAEAPQINYTSPDFSNTLNDTAISNLPINGGRWSSFAILTPTVVSNSSGFGLLSFRGISVLLNNNTVDGADNNQAFFSEERGRTRIGYSTPMGAVQEFQVNTSNYSAEYGRSAGGVVNTVTKSGTNGLHGEGYFFDRDNVWGAANPFTTVNVANGSGGFSPVNFKPTDWRKRAGFTVGGPLIKDKLFWIVSYDWYRRNFPGTAVTSNPNVFFAAPTCIGTAAWQSGNTCDAASQVGTLATRLFGANNAANDAAIGNPVGGLWANGLNGLNSMLGATPRSGDQNILYPKLDWAINAKNHASFAVNRMRWASPAGIQTQATNTFGTNSFGNDFVQDTWGVAKLDTLITSNFANQLRFQYGRDFEFEFSQNPTPYETANLVNCSSCTPGYVNPLGLPPQISITNGFTFGVPTFLQRPRFPDETRAQYADTMTWTHRNHTFKYGADISHVNDLSVNLRTQFGSYSYSNLTNYFSDFYCSQRTGSITCPGGTKFYNGSGFNQAFGPLGFEFNTMDYSFFGQDDWKVFPRLTVSFGLRWEYEATPKPLNGGALVNPAVPQTGVLPKDKNNWGPRVGFSLGLTGDGKTVLRGGYGMYYGRIINSAIYNSLITTGMPGGQFSFSFSPATAGSPTFPQILPPNTALAASRPNIVFFNNNFQAPQIHQYDLILERDLGWGTVVSVSYLGSLGRELPGFADLNLCVNAAQPGCQGGAGFGSAPGTITYTVNGGGPLGGGTLTEPLIKSRPTVPGAQCASGQPAFPNCALGAMSDIFSGINSRYDAFVFQINHRFNHHLQFNLNYTRSRSIDWGQNESTFSDTNDTFLPILFPGAMQLEKGRGIYDLPYRVVLNAVVTSPWKKSGVLGYFANDWEIAPIFQIQDGLPQSIKTTGTPTGGFSGGVNGSGGDFRIDTIGRNTMRLPGTWVTDLRVSKSFPIQERYRVELLADFFNLANKQNVTTLNNTAYSISGTSLNFLSTTFDTITNVNSNFVYSPRQIQLGARIKF
jgi:hypothetical protein